MNAALRKGPVYDPGLCRCCGSIKKCRVMNIEYEYQGQKEVYSDMIMDCFGLMLSALDGSTETERLICATCVLRLRDASAFRSQVLLCEEKLLQASIHVHHPNELCSDDLVIAYVDLKGRGTAKVLVCSAYLPGEKQNPTEELTKVVDYAQRQKSELIVGCDAIAHHTIWGSTGINRRENHSNMDFKTEVIKEELTEPDIAADCGDNEQDHLGDDYVDNLSDTSMTRESEGKQRQSKRRKAKTASHSKRDIVLRMRKITEKLKMMEHDGIAELPQPPKKPTVRFKTIDKHDKLFHNCTTIIESSFVCPFETSFSDYHCVYCREVFSDPKDLRNHTETHDPSKYKDLIRNRRIAQIDIFRIDCRLCDEKIDDLETLKTHIKTIHEKYLFPKIQNEVLPFKLTLSHLACIVCGSTFGYFHALKNHMALHYGSCICDICGAHFFEERRLTEHQKIHQKKPDTTYVCKECGKTFKSKHGRYLHVTSFHKKEPTYQCGKCAEVFFSYALRCRHRIEVHEEKREFTCEHCDKSYDNRKSWREHNRRAHLKISKHKCDICDRMFYLPCQLKEHMTTHTGERNFRCEYCGKSYPRLRALRLHMKSHGENKYRCLVCDATFTQNVSLRNHMKKQHQS